MAGPEVVRLINEFSLQTNKDDKSYPEEIPPVHHEQYNSFQDKFIRQVDKLITSFNNAGNPFEEKSGDLINIDSRIIADSKSKKILQDSEKKGIELYTSFVSERLSDSSTVSIFAPIKRQKISFFNTCKIQSSVQIQSKMANLQSDLHLFQRCLNVSMNRKLDMETFFKYENHPYPPSLSTGGQLRYATGKADLLVPLEKLMQEEDIRFPGTCDALVWDGAAVIHILQPRVSRTFDEYSNREFLQHIMGCINNVSTKRIDVVWDTYHEDSIKSSTRDYRGKGIRRQVLPGSPIPRNWRDFLRNDRNKEDLFSLLGKHLVTNLKTVEIVTNIDRKYVSSPTTSTSLVDLSCNNFEEADGRIIIHTKDAVLHGAKTVLIRTVDTDVLILAISFYFDLKSLGLEQLWLSFGSGQKHRYILAHTISEMLGREKSAAICGFHAFTGCDTVSAFAFHGKVSAWNTWKSYDNATAAFAAISVPVIEIPDDVYYELEQFVVYLYNKKCLGMTVDKARQFISTSDEKTFDRLPPTSEALKQHTLRAAYQAGQIWGQCLNPQAEISSPMNWGWLKNGSKWDVKWTTQPPIWEGCRDLVKCGCKTGCSTKCSCRRSKVQCVPYLCANCKNCSNMTQNEDFNADVNHPL